MLPSRAARNPVRKDFWTGSDLYKLERTGLASTGPVHSRHSSEYKTFGSVLSKIGITRTGLVTRIQAFLNNLLGLGCTTADCVQYWGLGFRLLDLVRDWLGFRVFSSPSHRLHCPSLPLESAPLLPCSATQLRRCRVGSVASSPTACSFPIVGCPVSHRRHFPFYRPVADQPPPYVRPLSDFLSVSLVFW